VLSVAAGLRRAGTPVLKPYPISARLRDPIMAFRVLQAAGIPVPETLVASHVSQLLPALDRGPLIIKPYRLSRAHAKGPEVVRDAAELAALGLIEEPVFAQRYHPQDGPARKLYAIGGELFGVLRRPPARTPFAPSAELADIAQRCGAAFGIDLFGVDIVESEGRAYVVDMASFPSFKGVPDAPRRSRVPSVPRVATYSQGMHGFGHIRRNATIAHALRASALHPVILMIAEAWQAGAIPMPGGVDCVTLPGLRKEQNGALNPRFL